MSGDMYCDWKSVEREIQISNENHSVLDIFPKEVGLNIVRGIASALNSGPFEGGSDIQSNLETDEDVKWTMQVICFGLSLPLTEIDTINHCISIYHNWLSVLHKPRKCVPRPIINNPDIYIKEILHHLYNGFVARDVDTTDTNTSSTNQTNKSTSILSIHRDLLQRQTVYCHRTLRNLLDLVITAGMTLSASTWNAILCFLLSINDTLLSSPIITDSLASILCTRIVETLFNVWLLACAWHFPSPSMWKTFSEMCRSWRHQKQLLVQWSSLNKVLTSRVLMNMYGPDFISPSMEISYDSEDMKLKKLALDEMDEDCIVQTWYRFLHVIGNPNDLTLPNVICNNPKFHDPYENDPCLPHPCSTNLPSIYQLAMAAISDLVNAFLGIDKSQSSVQMITNPVSTPTTEDITQPRSKKSTSQPPKSKITVPPSTTNQTQVRHSSSTDSLSQNSALSGFSSMSYRSEYASQRPRINAILHLFGAWLMEGALVGSTISIQSDKVVRSRAASLCMDHSSDVITANNSSDVAARFTIKPKDYAEGRSISIGTLCRVMCSHRTGEQVNEIYLARFYAILYYALCIDQVEIGVLSNTLFNSSTLLCVDLLGVQTLVPSILTAIETVLRDTGTLFSNTDEISDIQIRKSCIQLLMSLQCLPLHYGDTLIKGLLKETNKEITYISLQTRVSSVVHDALLNETDNTNTQILLCSIFLVTQDLAFHYNSGSNPQNDKKNIANIYFDKAISLIFNKLNTSWKFTTSCSIAAIQVLCGLAEMPIKTTLMCQRSVHWLCNLISSQCSRKATAQTKDLHSTICAAFHCLTMWLCSHPSLITDRQSLCNILEVLELGISGAKSQSSPTMETSVIKDSSIGGAATFVRSPSRKKILIENCKSTVNDYLDEIQNRSTETPKLKDQKPLRPVSNRVREAAEMTLTTLMDNVVSSIQLMATGSFPPPCGPESLSSLVDENTLAAFCGENTHFQYYVMDNSIIIGLSQVALFTDTSKLATVTALVRGPFGRYAWSMKLRHSPCVDKYDFIEKNEIKRPQYCDEVGTRHTISPKHFPDFAESIPVYQTGNSIPVLEKTQLTYEKDLDFLKDVVNFTPSEEEEEKVETNTLHPKECQAPKICTKHHATRLFLSHFGWLTLDAIKNPDGGSSLLPLDCDSDLLRKDLELLDDLACRPSDTVHIFYVRKGQTAASEILSNVTSKRHVSCDFLSFIKSLGWPVDVRQHKGWTGHTSTMAANRSCSAHADDLQFSSDTGGSLYDGTRLTLYYANVTDELAFIIPSTISTQYFSKSEPGDTPSPRQNRSDSIKDRRSTVTLSSATIGQTSETLDIRILVIWLEVYEDLDNFPTNDLISSTESGHKISANPIIYRIYIHALKNKLYRIHTKCSSKSTIAAPLVDGIVISHRSLGSIIRLAAMNTFRKRRLDCDSFQPPAVRRRHKIKDIIDKYQRNIHHPQFYASLFTS